MFGPERLLDDGESALAEPAGSSIESSPAAGTCRTDPGWRRFRRRLGAIGEGQDARFVLGRVVTLADEDFRRLGFHREIRDS